MAAARGVGLAAAVGSPTAVAAAAGLAWRRHAAPDHRRSWRWRPASAWRRPVAPPAWVMLPARGPAAFRPIWWRPLPASSFSSRRSPALGERAARRGRLGAGEHQHRLAGIEVLQQRTAPGLGSQARQEHRVRRIRGGIGDDVLVLVLGGGALAMTAAHLVAQVGRRGVDRRQRIRPWPAAASARPGRRCR